MPKRVGLYPARVSNPYQGRMGKALAERYTVVKVPKIKWLALGRLKRVGPKLDVLLVSWLENTLVSRKTGRLRRTGVLQFRLKLWVLGRLAHKLVMVRHNQFPHRTHPSDQARVKALIDQLEARFDAVITHSGHNTEGRFYVPHPLYETVESAPVEQPESPYCLAFGHILPYKNLLALVECWQGPCRLVIAGPGSNKTYLDALKQAAEGKPVDIRAGFLPEEDAITLVQGAACTVLAHAGEDMIVSGSYFFSISQGAPVYGIQTPFLSWLAANGSPVFGVLIPLMVWPGKPGACSVYQRRRIVGKSSKGRRRCLVMKPCGPMLASCCARLAFKISARLCSGLPEAQASAAFVYNLRLSISV